MCKTTWRINEAVELIYALDAGFIKNETGQTKEDFDLPCLVPRQDSNLRMWLFINRLSDLFSHLSRMDSN
jgi:hypothetical protein